MDTPPVFTIPDRFNEAGLALELSVRLRGAPANGVNRPTFTTAARTVIWVDGGDEVLVHLESLQVRMLPGTLLISVDLECDQTGRSPLVVALALGAAQDAAGLVGVTDDLPHGHPLLASRWGKPLQAAVWAGLLGLAKDHAIERRLAPHAIQVMQGVMGLQAGPPLSVLPTITPGRGTDR